MRAAHWYNYVLLRNLYALVRTFKYFYLLSHISFYVLLGQPGAEDKEDVEGRLGLVAALDLSLPFTRRLA